jgi:hypothetical protein
MDKPTENLNKNITLNDVQLASAYYPILIDLAKNKKRMTYGELVNKAKAIYPDIEYVQNAIAVSTGRKLDVVRIFTSERDLPDVTSLIINKNQGECGTGFTNHFNPENARSEVYAYDWSGVSNDFVIYIEKAEKEVKPKARLNRNQALEIMSNYYKENRAFLPSTISKKRDEIISMLMEGISAEESFTLAINGI